VRHGAERAQLQLGARPSRDEALAPLRAHGVHAAQEHRRARTFVKKCIPPSAVMSCSPNFESEPSMPPNEKGSRGTGTPMLTPIIAALKRRAK